MYGLVEVNAKAHSRMILDAAWAPGEGRAFATAGRDKTVKLWGRGKDEGGFVCKSTMQDESPVTAVDFVDAALEDGSAYLAVGTELGRLSIYRINLVDLVAVEKYVVGIK